MEMKFTVAVMVAIPVLLVAGARAQSRVSGVSARVNARANSSLQRHGGGSGAVSASGEEAKEERLFAAGPTTSHGYHPENRSRKLGSQNAGRANTHCRAECAKRSAPSGNRGSAQHVGSGEFPDSTTGTALLSPAFGSAPYTFSFRPNIALMPHGFDDTTHLRPSYVTRIATPGQAVARARKTAPLAITTQSGQLSVPGENNPQAGSFQMGIHDPLTSPANQDPLKSSLPK